MSGPEVLSMLLASSEAANERRAVTKDDPICTHASSWFHQLLCVIPIGSWDWYIYLYIYHKIQLNVGKHNIYMAKYGTCCLGWPYSTPIFPRTCQTIQPIVLGCNYVGPSWPLLIFSFKSPHSFTFIFFHLQTCAITHASRKPMPKSFHFAIAQHETTTHPFTGYFEDSTQPNLTNIWEVPFEPKILGQHIIY